MRYDKNTFCKAVTDHLVGWASQFPDATSDIVENQFGNHYILLTFAAFTGLQIDNYSKEQRRHLWRRFTRAYSVLLRDVFGNGESRALGYAFQDSQGTRHGVATGAALHIHALIACDPTAMPEMRLAVKRLANFRGDKLHMKAVDCDASIDSIASYCMKGIFARGTEEWVSDLDWQLLGPLPKRTARLTPNQIQRRRVSRRARQRLAQRPIARRAS